MFMKSQINRRMQLFFLFLLPIIGMLGLAYFVPLFLIHNGAKKTVDDFYRLEQAGDYGSSWELFHSQMKLKFNKDTYIQRRSHVFMQDFGVKTFEYKLGDVRTRRNWKISSEAPMLDKVYEVPVIMAFRTAFGNFEIHQNVYVIQEDQKWKVLWSYLAAI
jgi:hypothetical protein